MKLKSRKHAAYLDRYLRILPQQLACYDGTRLVLAYFAIGGLDVLNALDDKIPEEKKETIINWIYHLQVIDNEELVSGFQGSSTFNTKEDRGRNSPFKWSHIASTYTALCSLLILGDDLGRVDRDAITRSLKALQLPSGVFMASKEGTESDMRFVYCAACICYILDDWGGMDVEKTTKFILDSMTYEFGFGQGPDLEAHGGSSYCSIASLALMNKLSSLTDKQKHNVMRWLLCRQHDGFQGRPNKPVDTCYSFWVGAALKILGAFDFIDTKQNKLYIFSTQDPTVGGFSKWAETNPDPMHTYMGLAALSLMGYPGLEEVMPLLNITQRAHAHLKSLHFAWHRQL